MFSNEVSTRHRRGSLSLMNGLAAVILVLAGCPSALPPPPPPTSPPPPSTGGVTADQVKQLLDENLNTVNRDLTLWNIQPGLGTVMIEYGRRFALAQLAVQAGDWGMAQYQLDEAIEIQEVGETTRPSKADLLKNFEQTQLEPLLDDILAKDAGAFSADVASAINGCNACHQATGKPFVVVQPPSASPETFLLFAPSDPVTPESSGSATKGITSTSKADTPLSWAELTQMVDAAFDTVDRDLALWNIQPGLGTVMMEYGRRFAMLKFAADAGDWGMAQYQLNEQIEIQEVGETTRPNKADLLKNFEQTSLEPLNTAIEAQDPAAFSAAFTQAIGGCNACHQATGKPFVRVQTPPTLVEPFLQLAATEPQPEEGESEGSTAETPTFPSGNPTMADAEALIQDRLNTLDRTLALWNIQPGLGTVMMEYGYRFTLARLAVDAGNWGMAGYQIDEAIEIQEVGETTRPNKADLLKNFEQTSLEPLNAAIAAQDTAQFDAAFNDAIMGCNACHQATGHPFIVVKESQENIADFLNLPAGASQ